MCMSTPDTPAPIPPPPVTAPPVPTILETAANTNTSAESARSKGIRSLRIDKTQSTSGGGTGLNIPG